MDNSFEAIIYIIATILVIVMSVVRAQNKKKAAENKPEPPRNIFFPDMEMEPPAEVFREDEEDEEEVTLENEPVLKTVTVTEEPLEKESISTEELEKKQFENEGISVFQMEEKNGDIFSEEIKDDINLSASFFSEDKTKAEQKNAVGKEFDLKQAVIYSEILKRKEF